ncbi:quinone oxidoreductase family protein [Streptomyces evansiae]|uniref:quinone oxidoreductase family protein n=1 Tax=Streptomyces evansiae TaxID=3075535 RepID=UPI0028849481|nr:zinc-binding dehydrogenase [Streptomyces sp. DSM 41859]MDT0424469.1 zinc-binding dehydrogenase [Streptomyces sp. DSM 41859]
MKAIVIRSFGGPEGLETVDLPTPRPAAGQVLVATEAIGVGGVDVLIRRGALAAYGFAPGFVPGGESAGTVTETGPGADPAWRGRRVWAASGAGGSYAEYVLAPADQLVPLPPELTPAAAVTLGSAGAVAHFGLDRARLAAGERVLVRGASGSLGIAAVQLAVRAGAVVTATASAPDRAARLRALGAAETTGRTPTPGAAPYDVILDVVSGPDLPAFLGLLAPNGRLVSVGAVGGQPPEDFGTHLMTAFQKSLTFATLSLATIAPEALRTLRTTHFAAAARGDLATVVHATLPLTEAAAAHAEMDTGNVFGRLVLTPGN